MRRVSRAPMATVGQVPPDSTSGANLALSVEGAGKLKPSDVVLTAGTYDAFGTPTILSELEMWKEFGQPAQRYFNQKPNANRTP